jgi:hypothetical protein
MLTLQKLRLLTLICWTKIDMKFFHIRIHSIKKNINVYNKLNLSFVLLLIFISTGNCGLFEKKFPPNGTFCNVLIKPFRCIEIQFAERKIIFSPDEIYNLEVKSRVEYYYKNSTSDQIQMLVTSENRVQLSDGRFFLRRKVKK